MSFKYEIGDKVRVLDGSSIPKYRGSFVNSMRQYIGHVYKVVGRDSENEHGGYYLDGTGCFVFDERGLEPVASLEPVEQSYGATTSPLSMAYDSRDLIKSATEYNLLLAIIFNSLELDYTEKDLAINNYKPITEFVKAVDPDFYLSTFNQLKAERDDELNQLKAERDDELNQLKAESEDKNELR